MKKYGENLKGITLISLVVTIIILIILAGVSINLILGDNGIITKAKLAKENMELASEREAIQLQLLSEQISETNETIGKKLYDKTVENGSIWNIIVIKETNEIYGTGWSFVSEGSYVENYGTITSNWIINDTTKEIIELDSDKFVELSYNSALGVTDGLILNIDSTMIENGNEESIKEQLGSSVELVNFDWEDENSGIDSNSFNLDGVDDYIAIQYDNEEEKQTLAENGFTFEFYGKLTPGLAWNVSSSEWTELEGSNRRAGIFQYGYSSTGAGAIRVNEYVPDKTFIWNAGTGNYISDFSQNSTNPWNIFYDVSVATGEEVYFTLVLDTSESYSVDGVEYYTQSFYVNREKLFTGKYNKNSWDHFIENNLNNLDMFYVGYCNMTRRLLLVFFKNECVCYAFIC